MKQFFQRPLGRIVTIVATVLVIVVIASTIYIFGGGGAKAHGPVTAPTVVANSGVPFTIDPTNSQVTFTIHEIHLGQPNTVVGKTNQVAGQISVDQQHPAQSKLGEIRIDVSTLVTDNSFRNTALQGRILETSQPANQFATFVEQSISGLPTAIVIGQAVPVTITGSLTIHQSTNTETFTGSVTLTSDKTMTGSLQTTVKYEDFKMTIPTVPGVTGITDDVVLSITFTANA